MVIALVAFLVGCLPAEPIDHSVHSADGRFILDVTSRALSLREKGAGAPRWRVAVRNSMNPFVVADSGAWVAELHSSLDANAAPVTLYDAAGRSSDARLIDVLSQEEQQYFQVGGCGTHWLSRFTVAADVITFEIIQGGQRRPNEGAGPTTRITLDAKRGTIHRSASVPRPGIAELISLHRNEGLQSGAFQVLQLKAQLLSSRDDRALCEFFASFAQGQDAEPRRAAINALEAAACAGELSALSASGPRGDDGDLATLEGLEERDPAAAAQFALVAMRQRRAPELLRIRAVRLLLVESAPWRWEVTRLALADPAPAVRGMALSALSGLTHSQEVFSLLLAQAVGESTEAPGARLSVLNYLLDRQDPRWGEQLTQAAVAGKLERWPASLVVVGQLLEKRGEQKRAEDLYTRAMGMLAASRPDAGAWDEAEFWCEAKLRLAQAAAVAGLPVLALRLANEVLDSGLREYVAVTSPARYAGGSASSTADTIARQFIALNGAPLPLPGDAVRVAMKSLEDAREGGRPGAPVPMTLRDNLPRR